MSRRQQIRTEGLGRLLVYVLGHRPDEFGLVPDKEGYVSYKELLHALHEEEEWRYVRQSHIHEVLLGNDRSLFESEEDRIRSRERRWELDLHGPAARLPKILFAGIRRSAHPVAMENGLKGSDIRPVVLTPDRDVALRIGQRRDQDPVVLEILAEAAADKGILFYPFGDLFVSAEIPARFIAGPPLSKEMLESRKDKEKATEKSTKSQPSPTPGTFMLQPSRDPDLHRRTKGKKQEGWKEAARKMRKRTKG